MPNMPEGSNLYYMDEGLRRAFATRAALADSNSTSIRDMLSRQLEIDLYRPMHAALRQRLPAGTKYERIEPKTLTKFEVGAD